MTNPEITLRWIIRHRDEPEVTIFLCEESKKMDEETVEETLCHIWAGFYDAEPIKEVFAEQVCKHCYAVKRDRKIAERRKHYKKVCERKGC